LSVLARVDVLLLKKFELPYLTKPVFKSPCNGCGLCCQTTLCDVAERMLPLAKAPCPALEYEGGRTWCGLVRHPSRHLGLKFDADFFLIGLVKKAMPLDQGCGMEDPVFFTDIG
jgi:hypothetical protein